jgi:hypothetical protein
MTTSTATPISSTRAISLQYAGTPSRRREQNSQAKHGKLSSVVRFLKEQSLKEEDDAKVGEP